MSNKYVLVSSQENERLQMQARAWEPEVEVMLDRIGVQKGWNCLDLGCGAMGILQPLSKRVGEEGCVIGVEKESSIFSVAREFVEKENLSNVQLVLNDAFHSGLPYDTFDLVHERFVLPYVTPEFFLEEMIDLAAPGGIVATQEPDNTSWNFFPYNFKWLQLKDILIKALYFQGDINIGQKTFVLMKNSGLEQIKMRAAVLALPSKHPYMRMPIQAATALRSLIVQKKLATNDQLDDLLANVERLSGDAETIQITFTVLQVWGIKPQNVLH
jgi:SAM-dependent methyltransferase